MQVKRCKPSDSDLMLKIVKQFKQKKISAAYAKDFLANPANYLLVAEIENEPTGFLLGYALQRIDNDPKMLYIHEFDVSPEYQRKGVGRKLVEKIRDEIKKEGIKKSFLITQRSNQKAVAFYKSTGAKRPNQDDIIFTYK